MEERIQIDFIDKLIVIFRYHKDFEVCRNHLELMRKFNPEIEIHGIFGGNESEFVKFDVGLKDLLDSNYCFHGKSKRYKWRNGDLILVDWFKEVGNKLDFDSLVMIEWDMLVFEDLKDQYLVEKDTFYIPSWRDVNEKNKWWWTTAAFDITTFKSPKKEYQKLKEQLKIEYNWEIKNISGNFGLMCIPKNFLEEYSKLNIHKVLNDEVRLLSYMQILGYRYNTMHLFHMPGGETNLDSFNASKKQIAHTKVMKELNEKDGMRIFHPYRKIWNNSEY